MPVLGAFVLAPTAALSTGWLRRPTVHRRPALRRPVSVRTRTVAPEEFLSSPTECPESPDVRPVRRAAHTVTAVIANSAHARGDPRPGPGRRPPSAGRSRGRRAGRPGRPAGPFGLAGGWAGPCRQPTWPRTWRRLVAPASRRGDGRAGPGGRSCRAQDDDLIWRQAVAVGAERVAVLPASQDWVVQALAEALDGPRRCAVVGVVGGCGWRRCLGPGDRGRGGRGRSRAAHPARRPRPAGRWCRPVAGGRAGARAALARPARGPEAGSAAGCSGRRCRGSTGCPCSPGTAARPVIVPPEAAAAVAAGCGPRVRPRRGRPGPLARRWRQPAGCAGSTWRWWWSCRPCGRSPRPRRVVAGLDGAVDDVRAVVRGPGAGPGRSAEVAGRVTGTVAVRPSCVSEPGLAPCVGAR